MSFLPHSPPISSHSAPEIFFGRDGGRIGGRYHKVIYREYTDGTFTTIKPQNPDSQHLGLLGKGRFLISQLPHTSFFVLLHWCLVFHQSSLNTLRCFCPAFVQVRSWGQRKEILSEWHSWIKLIKTTASSLMACTMTKSSREAAMMTVRKQPSVAMISFNCKISGLDLSDNKGWGFIKLYSINRSWKRKLGGWNSCYWY